MVSSMVSLITDVIFPMDAPLLEDVRESPRDCVPLKQAANKFNFPHCAP